MFFPFFICQSLYYREYGHVGLQYDRDCVFTKCMFSVFIETNFSLFFPLWILGFMSHLKILALFQNYEIFSGIFVFIP